jgi:hypothetical protein
MSEERRFVIDFKVRNTVPEGKRGKRRREAVF